MFFWKNTRRKKRYTVSWNALLEARFHDFQDHVDVKVTNFSDIGALLNSNRIFLNNQHLISLEQRPELNLKIFSPQGAFESMVEIQWYNWSVHQNAYEIGVEFIYILKEDQDIIEKNIHSLNTGEKSESQFLSRFFLSRNVHAQA